MYRYISVYTDPYICPVLPSPIALPPCLMTASYVSVCMCGWVGARVRAHARVCAFMHACVCVSAMSVLC